MKKKQKIMMWTISWCVLGVLALTCPLGAGASSEGKEMNAVTLGSEGPRGTRRVVHTSDTGSHFGSGTWLFGDPATPEELRRWIRTIADGGADTYVPDVYAQGTASWYRTTLAPRPQYQIQRFAPMMDAGTIPLEVYIDEAHKQGMELLAGFRMNDRHGHSSRWVLDNRRDWFLKGLGGVDYARPEVRDWIFSIVEEVPNRFDVDGVELNFIRHGYCFSAETARSQHPVMTAFMRRIRQMLDEIGDRKGRRLLLGARVPTTLDECHELGFDVPTWISEKIIDYVAPSPYHCTDFNAPYDEFARLTRGSECYLYPTLHADVPGLTSVMSLDNCRAVVQNFYGAGADGFSTFNYDVYMWGQLRSKGYPGPADMYPKAMGFFKILRDPEAVLAGDRHYLFYPLHAHETYGPRGYRKLPSPHARAVLKRSEPTQRAEYRFRICERLPKRVDLPTDKLGRYEGAYNSAGNVPGVWLHFRALGMQPGDEVAIDINGKEIPADGVRHIWYQEGRPAWQGRALPAYTECQLGLTAPHGVYGDNHLGIRLVRGASGAEEDIVVDELEVLVHVRD